MSRFGGGFGRKREEEPGVVFEGALVIRTSEKAILVLIGEDEHWLPKSQLHSTNELADEGDEGRLVITQWIANEKGLG